MNWKIILFGGLTFFVGTWLIGPISGPLIHEGILADAYQATASSWRPELMQKPPDMAALLPLWIPCGLISSFLVAAVYAWVRPAISGAGWQRGLKYGAMLAMLGGAILLGLFGVFNLPAKIWAWWWVEWLVSYLLAGLLLGLVAQKVSPAAP